MNGTMPSAGMAFAIRSLGGPRRWRGRVRGLFGFLSREFEVDSTGTYERGALVFSEHMKFSDGKVIERVWTIAETGPVLDLKADNIRLLRPGVLRGEWLVFEYSLSLGGVWCRYVDRFRSTADGRVENRGTARFLGVPILKVEASALLHYPGEPSAIPAALQGAT